MAKDDQTKPSTGAQEVSPDEDKKRTALLKAMDTDHDRHLTGWEVATYAINALRIPTGDPAKDKASKELLQKAEERCKAPGLNPEAVVDPETMLENPDLLEKMDYRHFAKSSDPEVRAFAAPILAAVDDIAEPTNKDICGVLKKVTSEDVKAPAAKAAPAGGAAKTTTHR